MASICAWGIGHRFLYSSGNGFGLGGVWSKFGSCATEARAKLAGAVQGGNLQQMAEANTALTAPLGRLLAIAENYPQLKSNENFRALQDQLEGTENRIAVARQDYNEAVNRYNAYIRRFPQVLTAKVLGKGPREYFELQTPGAAQAPKVDFSK